MGVRKIKVLIANRPRLMRELVAATLSDQSDIEIIGVLEDEASIPINVEQSHPDVLIISSDRAEDRPHICDVLLDRFPHLRILALAAQQNTTVFYWASLDIRSNQIENSEESILNALRGVKLMAAAISEIPTRSRAN